MAKQDWSAALAIKGIALFVNVEEGPQYRLSGITFSNNRAISNIEGLRRLFPIEDGEVFRREKIARGLENLRHAYASLRSSR
jgi:outer membrane protein assembly factor BamA